MQKYLYVLLSFLIIVCLSFFSSCNFFQEEKQSGKTVARAFDKLLFDYDLSEMIPEGTSKEDSIQMAKTYIDAWIREQVILHQAQEELPPEKKDFSDKIEKYHNSLLSYSFEKEIIGKKIDTSINIQEIQNFYKNHQRQFLLKKPIIQSRIAILDVEAPNLYQVEKWFSSNKKNDLRQLDEYCLEQAYFFNLDDSAWVFIEQACEKIPSNLTQNINWNQNKRTIRLADSSFIYLIYNKANKNIGENAPLDFERDNIRNIILLQRKQKYIHKYYQNLYLKAKENENFEIYKQ